MLTPPRTERIGVRVARYRDLRGLTQQQLADEVGRRLGRTYTRQHMSLIESGRQSINRTPLLIALATALGVSPTDLLGQPYQPSIRTDLDPYLLAASIRTILDLLDTSDADRRTGEQLTAAGNLAMTARMACDWPTMMATLPDLLSDSYAAFYGTSAPTSDAAAAAFVQAATASVLALKPAGWLDLAIRLAELAVTVATDAGQPIPAAMAAYVRSQCLVTAGNRSLGGMVAARAAARLDQAHGADGIDPVQWRAWLGMLHLQTALAVAGTDTAAADTHLAEATALAADVADGTAIEFTAANTATWAVGIALEAADPVHAQELAADVNAADLQTPDRRFRLHLDGARAAHAAGDHPAAVRRLLAAEAAAPGHLRTRSSGVEMVGHMVQVAPTGPDSELAELAALVGV